MFQTQLIVNCFLFGFRSIKNILGHFNYQNWVVFNIVQLGIEKISEKELKKCFGHRNPGGDQGTSHWLVSEIQ